MDAIVSYFQTQGLDLWRVLEVCGIILLGGIALHLLTSWIFGKKSLINRSISSSIAIIYVYAATIILMAFAPQLHILINPLPYVSISGDTVTLFSFETAGYAQICSQLLSMIILSFLMNLADGWLPEGKNPISWLFFRLATIVLGLILHSIVTYLFVTYLPYGIVVYAPAVLLAILILLLLTGALKLIVGLIMATVSPIIAVLYTFFFASLVGKQITRAVFTTALLTGLVYFMEHLGVVSISIAAGALVAYIPFILVLLVVWYLVHRGK